jgi:hypothetical protein
MIFFVKQAMEVARLCEIVVIFCRVKTSQFDRQEYDETTRNRDESRPVRTRRPIGSRQRFDGAPQSFFVRRHHSEAVPIRVSAY